MYIEGHECYTVHASVTLDLLHSKYSAVLGDGTVGELSGTRLLNYQTEAALLPRMGGFLSIGVE